MIQKDTQQAINALFTFLNNLDSVVFWICSPDYKKSIYVNDAYEFIWGRPRESIYTDLSIWKETLLPEDYQYNLSEFNRRSDNIGGSMMTFRIHRPDNELIWIKNISYTLAEKDGKPSIIAGIDEVISPERWQIWRTQKQTELAQDKPLLTEFLKILQNEYNLEIIKSTGQCKPDQRKILTSLIIDNNKINLTSRESECLNYLLTGKSAKETARIMQLSPRTVETYLDNLRRKSQCRTKLALIGKVQKQLAGNDQ